MNGFTLYKDYYNLITILEEKEQAELLLAISKFMFEDIEPVLNDRQEKIFNSFKRALIKSKEQSKRRTKQEPNENQIETKTKPNAQPIKNTSNDVIVNVYDNNIKSNNRGMGEEERKFKKPTLDEVKEYCKERNNNVNAQTFIDFYESKGWMVGKNKMVNWKACVRTWEKKYNNETYQRVTSGAIDEISEEEQQELNKLVEQLGG